MDLVQELTRAEGMFYPGATPSAPSEELHRDMLSYCMGHQFNPLWLSDA